MTLHAIRKTRSRMRFGITESRTGEILRAEMRAVGLSGGDGLVLFGGELPFQLPFPGLGDLK